MTTTIHRNGDLIPVCGILKSGWHQNAQLTMQRIEHQLMVREEEIRDAFRKKTWRSTFYARFASKNSQLDCWSEAETIASDCVRWRNLLPIDQLPFIGNCIFATPYRICNFVLLLIFALYRLSLTLYCFVALLQFC